MKASLTLNVKEEKFRPNYSVWFENEQSAFWNVQIFTSKFSKYLFIQQRNGYKNDRLFNISIHLS